MRAAARSAASTFELAAVLAACAAAGGLALAAGVAAGEAEAPGGMGRAAGVAALVPGRWLLVREAAPGWLADGRAGPRAEAARRWLDSLLLLSLASPLAPALGGAAAWEAGHGATALLAAWTLRRAWGVSAAAGLLVLPLATWAVLGAARWQSGPSFGRDRVFAAAAQHIAHRSFDRRAYATGAVRAALWAHGRAPGLYDMKHVLGMA